MKILPAVAMLGITQIIGYGTLYYTFGVIVPGLSADTGVSQPLAFAFFSAALLAGAAIAPLAGRLIDRHGGRRVMAAGSVLAALALAALSQAQGPVSLALSLVAIEAVSALVLYDAAFATLAHLAGPGGARRAITRMTLWGGFASTLFWPLTQWLLTLTDWRGICLIHAGLHLALCLPLHALLPAGRAVARAGAEAPAFAPLPAHRQTEAMMWLTLAFAITGAVLSAVAAQMIPLLVAWGVPAATAVLAGMFMGPAQVAVRVIDLRLGQGLHPMTTAQVAGGLLVLALALLALAPVAGWAAAGFGLVYGLSAGLTSIVRGTVPLALFGAEGFGARLGVLARVRLVAGAAAPFALSLALAHWDARVAAALCLGLALAGLAALSRIPR